MGSEMCIRDRFFASGAMAREIVVPSLSPSMDIQVSSNFERLLFELLDRDGAATATVMQRFAKTGRFEVDDSVLARARRLFSAYRLDDAGTLAEIAETATQSNMTIDPHSAVGVYAARAAHANGTVSSDVPIVALACCLLYTSPSPRDATLSRMPSSA